MFQAPDFFDEPDRLPRGTAALLETVVPENKAADSPRRVIVLIQDSRFVAAPYQNYAPLLLTAAPKPSLRLGRRLFPLPRRLRPISPP